MTAPIQIEGGEVLANLEERTITGRLIPFGEEGRTNVGRFMVEAGALDISDAIADPSIISLNLDHDPTRNVGRATRVWQQADGVYCSWAIARTRDGDTALADALDPARTAGRKRVSGEFGPAVIRAGKLVAGRAKLWGSGLVPMGAFPGAMVLAADTPDSEESEVVEGEVINTNHTDEVYTDETGREYRRIYDSETVDTGDGTQTITTITETTSDNTNTDPTESDDNEEELTVTAAAIPTTQRTGAPGATTAQRGPSKRDVFAAIATFRDPEAVDRAAATRVLAALSDITAPALLDGGKVARPLWMDQIYQGIPYVREYVGLGNLGNDITLGGKEGYTLHRGTPAAPANRLGGTWAGNKSAIASGTGFTKSHESFLQRYAFGADVGRELFDLDGGAGAIAAFFGLVAEDELQWSDERALETWRMVGGLPVANKAYPAVAGNDYPTSLGQVIQGILAVKAKKADKRRDVPTFIIANEIAYEQLIYTPKDLVPEFVNFTASTDWQGTGDGLRLVVGDTGITSTSSVIVGAGLAVDFDELSGGPLRIDALDIAKGGVDQALHGYLQTFIKRSEAVVHVGTSDARANTFAYEVGDLAKAGAATYQAVAAGTSDAAAPAAPAVGETVTDGTVTWKRLA